MVVPEPADSAIVSAGVSTKTVSEQPLVVVPGGQLEPAAVEATAVIRFLSPVSGFLTVTENVTVAVPPGLRLPVQVSTGLAYNTVPPVVAAASLS